MDDDSYTRNRTGKGGDSATDEGGYGGQGGGIRNAYATAILNRCTISGNVCGRGGSGCEARDGGSSIVYSGAGRGGDGGGMSNDSSTVTILNSTLVGNSSGDPGLLCQVTAPNTGGNGGGIHAAGSTIDVTFTTISENTNTGTHGGGGMSISFGSTRVRNTVVSGNITTTSAPDLLNLVDSGATPLAFSGAVALGSTDGTDSTGVAPIVLGSTAVLGGLADHGGRTFTMLPVDGSAIVNVIAPAECTDLSGAPIAIDQRGGARPVGTHCDIGSVEAW